MCSVQKCTFWRRGAEPTCKSPERPPSNVRPGRPHNLPQVRFLSVQVFVTYCANATTKEVRRSARTSTSLPRTRSSFSAFFLHSDTHRQSHCKGSYAYDHTADSFSQSPMLSATRSPKYSGGAQNETREKKRINIDIAVAANLEP